jgi:hypothetical protein
MSTRSGKSSPAIFQKTVPTATQQKGATPAQPGQTIPIQATPIVGGKELPTQTIPVPVPAAPAQNQQQKK